MADKEALETIQWIEKRLQHIRSTVRALERAIDDYLQWMTSQGYAARTRESYKQMLNKFLGFIKHRRCEWDAIFTLDALKLFQKVRGIKHVHAVKGLARYLFEHNKIRRPIEKPYQLLPDIYEQYLVYHAKSRQAPYRKIRQIRRVLSAFNDYLQRNTIKLSHLRIEHIDAFLTEFNVRFTPQTCRLYRCHLRGFLTYLYRQRRILHRDLAPLVIGAPLFAQAKPPQFLRPNEVKRLFDSLETSSAKELRNYAMVHLAYYLGLRPQEISLITLDDISFSKAELSLRVRKSNNPITLPLPDNTIKAIAAYIVGGRPKSTYRRLFLNLMAPHRPISAGMVGRYITDCLRKAALQATAYWLRHTYAQNLLEAGASIYEIKEMLGHDSIESSRKYLHIHILLMRKVLFDEKL